MRGLGVFAALLWANRARGCVSRVRKQGLWARQAGALHEFAHSYCLMPCKVGLVNHSTIAPRIAAICPLVKPISSA